MEADLRRHAGFEVERRGEIAAILEQFDSRERGTKRYVKRPPMSGLAQRGGQPLGGVPQEIDFRHP